MPTTTGVQADRTQPSAGTAATEPLNGRIPVSKAKSYSTRLAVDSPEHHAAAARPTPSAEPSRLLTDGGLTKT